MIDGSISLEPKRGDRALMAMVAIVTTILTVAGLGVAQAVFAPLSFALFVLAIVWPLQARLQAWMPKLLALALTMLATVVVILGFGWVITWGFARVGHYVVSEAARFQIAYNQLNDWLEGHGIAVGSLWAEHFNMGWLIRAFYRITSIVNGALSFTLIVVIYVMLGLLEIDDAVRRLRRTNTRELGITLLAGGAKTAIKLRRYMLVRSLVSVVTGAFVCGFI
ncbi:MAG: hypothetical protein JOZ17_17630, partial [Acetobacteraceae bacterium]|nr:hypothetical protein [Acetobacteraceae bacterium]